MQKEISIKILLLHHYPWYRNKEKQEIVKIKSSGR